MSDYLDGELGSAARTRMERHVGECADCRWLLAGLRRVLNGLHRLAAPSPAVDLAQIAASVQARLTELD
jgi:anti-sigma factor RsiW